MKLNELFEANRSASNISLDEIKDHKKLAKKLNISVDILKGLSDKEIQAILQNLGFHDFTPNHKFDKKELQLGIKIEREHTNNDLVATLIARDHLSEDPHYYAKLEKMEHNK